jgi:hypothetical protein
VRVDAESHQLKAIAVHMAEARRALETFLRETEAARIAEDLPAWESRAENSRACVHGCAELAFGHADLGVRD